MYLLFWFFFFGYKLNKWYQLNRTTLNKGYAFVNFTNEEAVSKFKAACNHKPWCQFGSRKVLEIAYARIQASSLLIPFPLHIYIFYNTLLYLYLYLYIIYLNPILTFVCRAKLSWWIISNKWHIRLRRTVPSVSARLVADPRIRFKPSWSVNAPTNQWYPFRCFLDICMITDNECVCDGKLPTRSNRST